MTDDTTQAPQGEEQPMAAPRMEDIVLSTVFYCTELAWRLLGIQADPQTHETATDLPQAKLAIDVLAALVPVLENRFGTAEMRDLRTNLSNLQLNYVERAAKAEG